MRKYVFLEDFHLILRNELLVHISIISWEITDTWHLFPICMLNETVQTQYKSIICDPN